MATNKMFVRFVIHQLNVKSSLIADLPTRLLAENKLTDELPNTKILNEKKI